MPKRKNKVSQKQLNAIRANYARIANQEKTTLPKKKHSYFCAVSAFSVLQKE